MDENNVWSCEALDLITVVPTTGLGLIIGWPVIILTAGYLSQVITCFDHDSIDGYLHWPLQEWCSITWWFTRWSHDMVLWDVQVKKQCQWWLIIGMDEHHLSMMMMMMMMIYHWWDWTPTIKDNDYWQDWVPFINDDDDGDSRGCHRQWRRQWWFIIGKDESWGSSLPPSSMGGEGLI